MPTTHVQAQMNYSVDNGRPIDYYFYEPLDKPELNPPGTDTHPVSVHDGWSEVAQLSVDKQGFELHEFDAQFTLWFSADDHRRGLAAVTDISERVNAFNELEQSQQQ